MNMDGERTKSRLMDTIKLINKTPVQVLKILRENTVSQINSIERNSKSIRDPDPLSSTLANISLKYPISVTTDIAHALRMPRHLLLNKEDMRKYNRTPCKMEAIEWYITSAPDPNDNMKAIIKGLLEHTSKKLRKINQMKWQDISFHVGNVTTHRKLVPLNPLDVKIPRELRNQVMAKTLGINNFIEYTSIPQYMLDYTENLMSQNNFLPLRSIPNVIHFLSSILDEKYRFLPTVSGVNADFMLVSHVLFQPRYICKELGDFLSTDSRKNELIDTVCVNLINYYQNYDISMLRNAVKTIKIAGMTFLSLLQNAQDTRHVRIIKACLGLPVSSCIEKFNCFFYPVLSRLYRHDISNVDGFRYFVFDGEETVYFEYNGIKGMFEHNAEFLKEIRINMCPERILRSLIPFIAVYCKMGFRGFKGKNIRTLERNALKHWSNRIHEIILVTRQQYLNWEKQYKRTGMPLRIGRLLITTGIDFQDSITCKVNVEGDGLFTSDGQLFLTIPQIQEFSSWDEKVDTDDPLLMKYHQPGKLLTMVVNLVWSNYKKMLEMAKQRSWCNYTYHLIEHVPARMRSGVIIAARANCITLVSGGSISPVILLINYLFTGAINNFKETNIPIVDFRFGPFRINLGLVSSDLQYRRLGDGSGGLYLNNELILLEKKRFKARINQIGVIPNMEMVATRKRPADAEMKPLIWLIENSDNIAEGKRYLTSFQGTTYLVKKNSNFPVEINNTMMRANIFHNRSDTVFELRDFIEKRKFDQIIKDDDDDAQSSKRMRIEHYAASSSS